MIKFWQVLGNDSLTYADWHLYCLDEKGKMSPVKVHSENCIEVASFSVPRSVRGSYWAHPAVSNGRLFVRHSDWLYAYDIREGSGSDPNSTNTIERDGE